MRRAVAVLPAVLLLAGCGATAGTVSPGAPPAPPRSTATVAPPAPAEPAPADPGPGGPCTGSTLDVSATPARPDGSGVEAQELVFRNTGTRACELSGYPGVSFVAGNAGNPVGPRAGVDGPRNTVLLEPGRAATATLRVRPVEEYPAGECAPQDVRGIRVAPPGGSGGLFVPRPGAACAGEPDRPQATVTSVTGR